MKSRKQLCQEPHGIEVRAGSVVVSREVTCKRSNCTVSLLRQAGIESGVDAYGEELVYVGRGRYVHITELKDGETICDNCGENL